ncbi:MAG: aminotransferase class V-fold PLP-dependent enzyme, partial [Clostridiales Family XIII bacterium]|nr:aminotransferase class V-fold PLP-dependent enzyme [Clostridiales Family XIII bacterium]
MEVYLDNAATSRASEAVCASMQRMLREDYGNPSSAHRMGQQAERAMKQARSAVASLLGAQPRQIVFTGSGTEADNLAFHCAFKNPSRIKGAKILVSAVEHPAVLVPAMRYEALGATLVRLPVDGKGMVCLDALEAEMDDRALFLSVMHVNNEVGTIQPVERIGRLVAARRQGGSRLLWHVDAVQSYGKIPASIAPGAAL